MACELGKLCNKLKHVDSGTITRLFSRLWPFIKNPAGRHLGGTCPNYIFSVCSYDATVQRLREPKCRFNPNHQSCLSEHWKASLALLVNVTPKQLLQSFLWDLTKIPGDLRYWLPDCWNALMFIVIMITRTNNKYLHIPGTKPKSYCFKRKTQCKATALWKAEHRKIWDQSRPTELLLNARSRLIKFSPGLLPILKKKKTEKKWLS